jgi:hypothetical protein
MTRAGTRSRIILGSRKPVVAVRVVARKDDGRIVTEFLARRTERRSRLDEALKSIFLAGKDRLSPEEWETLLADEVTGQGGDPRWALLCRLAIVPRGEDGRRRKEYGLLKDQFAALPDGTPFSMELLLGETQGGDRTARTRNAGGGTKPSFNRLPVVIRVSLCQRANDAILGEGCLWPREFANYLNDQVATLKLGVAAVTGKQVTEFRDKIQDAATREQRTAPAFVTRIKRRSPKRDQGGPE